MTKAHSLSVVLTAVSILVPLSNSSALAQSAADRRAELAEISDRIAGEPDPLMRIANLEDIVAEGDYLKTQLAIRTAMGVDDPQLHAVAARAYLSNVRDVTFEWILPEGISDKVGKNEKLTSEERNYHQIHLAKGGRIPVRFSGFQDDGTFKVEAYGQILEEASGRMAGDRLVFRAKMRTAGIAFCNFEVRPTTELNLDGHVSCEDRLLATPTRIVAPMF